MVTSVSSPSSESTRRRSPTSSGSSSSLAQDVDDVDVEVAGEQVTEGDVVAAFVEEVGDDDDDALALVAGGECLGGGGEVGRAGGGQVVEILDDAQHLGLRPRRPERPSSSWLLKASIDDAVVVHQADEREGGGDLLAVVELGRVAEIHRQAGVEQDRDVEIFFFEEELQEELVEAAVDVPVEVAEVVAGGVVAVVGELDGRARGACCGARPSCGRRRCGG